MPAAAPDPAAAILARARRIVIKIGSALLIDSATRSADLAWAQTFAHDAARLRAGGATLLIVSSGAVALGRSRLRLPPTRSLTLDEKQAAAAAGQSVLMRVWEDAFAPHATPLAQILLTRDDTEVRRRWLNARSTVETVLRLGAVPIINENDTVATEELRYGDNDRLAARVAQLAGADLLVLLSDVDGLYTADPRRNPDAAHIPHVAAITPAIEAMAGGANLSGGVGTGGMASKIAAARIAHGAGCTTLIAAGRVADSTGPLAAIEAGARATRIDAHATPAAAYKQWIAGHLAPAGTLRLDAGACAALARGNSLLPAGVRGVTGAFGSGDIVRLEDPSGHEIARGVIAYDALEARAIAGLQSDAIEATLGYPGRATLVHRDDLVLTQALHQPAATGAT